MKQICRQMYIVAHGEAYYLDAKAIVGMPLGRNEQPVWCAPLSASGQPIWDDEHPVNASLLNEDGMAALDAIKKALDGLWHM